MAEPISLTKKPNLDWVITIVSCLMVLYHMAFVRFPLLNALHHQNIHLGFAVILVLLGAMREAAQMVSYEVPIGILTIMVVSWAGSMSMIEIIGQQHTGWMLAPNSETYLGFLSWNAFKTPFMFIAFFIYLAAVLAATKRHPFDLPEAESELVAGFLTEYSGMRWAYF